MPVYLSALVYGDEKNFQLVGALSGGIGTDLHLSPSRVGLITAAVTTAYFSYTIGLFGLPQLLLLATTNFVLISPIYFAISLLPPLKTRERRYATESQKYADEATAMRAAAGRGPEPGGPLDDWVRFIDRIIRGVGATSWSWSSARTSADSDDSERQRSGQRDYEEFQKAQRRRRAEQQQSSRQQQPRTNVHVKDPLGFYSALGIPPTSSPEQVKNAFRRLALAHHPDRAPASEKQAAEARFKKLAHAYSVLRDAHKRALYDATGTV